MLTTAHFCLLLSFGLLGAAEIVANWTLFNFSRACVPEDSSGISACTYYFGISESTTDPDAPKIPCTLWVYSDPGQPATQKAFNRTICREAAAAAYRIGNGWDRAGFITLTVQNVMSEVDAFFGYTDEELRDGKVIQNKTAPAYKLGTFSPAVRRAVRRHPETMFPVLLCEEWALSDVSRVTADNRVQLSFDLHRCPLDVTPPQHCFVNTTGWSTSPDFPVAKDQFFDKRCEGYPNLSVSWGYKADTDGAVMTVVE